MTEALHTAGTRKGLFIGYRRGEDWEPDESPNFTAQALYSVAVDTRGPTPELRAGVYGRSTPGRAGCVQMRRRFGRSRSGFAHRLIAGPCTAVG